MSTAGADDLRALSSLCTLAGVDTEFTDNEGARRRARPSTLVAVLGALGVPIGGVGDAQEAVRAMRAGRARRVMEPVHVQWVGERRSVRLVLPADADPDAGWHELELEDGTVRRRPLSEIGWTTTARDEVDGRTLDTYELPLDGGGRALPPGYHRLTVHAAGLRATALVMVAPTCPVPTRGWGTFLPLHALRTDRDRGVGTYADLARLAQWTGHLGGALVGTLPLYPVFFEEPVDPSPYRPVTKLGLSELYIDPAGLPELAIAPEARRLLRSDAVRGQIEVARASRFVAYGPVMTSLRSVLAPMAAALFAAPSARRSELEAFAAARPELAAYARFRSACERFGSSWARWSSAEASSATDGIGDEAEHFHLYVQWVAEQQLAAVSEQGNVGLYLDIPVGVHPCGFDPWWQGHSFAPGVSGGAPPDAFFSGGQNWGFPPLHPEGLRHDGYRYLRAQMGQACRHADAVRVDHVMGLDRLFWLPHGSDAGDGAYVQYRNEEMRAVVALEASRSGTAVVGEDLGTVPDRVRSAMAHDNMLRSWVFQFETSPRDPLPVAPQRSLASWGTHDLPRFAAYWNGDDIEERERSGSVDRATAADERAEREANRLALQAAVNPEGHGSDIDTEELLRACLRYLAAGPALLVLVDLEDLWLEREPQNRPGTGPEVPNWRLRAAQTLEQVQGDAAATGLLSEVDGLRREPTPVGPTVGSEA
ncbi:MAG TPA: 4-alpha-glucanotransferase [Acidimicrobiales bacterium]|nr:4-alpha-glucanotransferase [Acidimicrobiales bacterium]